jgi:hypothetical protein
VAYGRAGSSPAFGTIKQRQAAPEDIWSRFLYFRIKQSISIDFP